MIIFINKITPGISFSIIYQGQREPSMTLRDLPIGKTATILSVGGEGALRQHFLDMGLIPKGEVTMVKYAPMGDSYGAAHPQL